MYLHCRFPRPWLLRVGPYPPQNILIAPGLLDSVFTVLMKRGGETEGWFAPPLCVCACMCAAVLRPLCSEAYNVRGDNRGSVRRHCACVCVEGWGTEWTRIGMTNPRPKGPRSNKLHHICVLSLCGNTHLSRLKSTLTGKVSLKLSCCRGNSFCITFWVILNCVLFIFPSHLDSLITLLWRASLTNKNKIFFYSLVNCRQGICIFTFISLLRLSGRLIVFFPCDLVLGFFWWDQIWCTLLSWYLSTTHSSVPHIRTTEAHARAEHKNIDCTLLTLHLST